VLAIDQGGAAAAGYAETIVQYGWQTMHKSAFSAQVSEHHWRTHYRWCEGGHMQEPSIDSTWDRVALAVSGAEAHHHNDWRERFRAILSEFRFLPGGRILASAGTSRRATLFNSFVMGPIEDSVQGIFNTLREVMVTLQAGGAVGLDISTLRPMGAQAVASGHVASGPVSFLTVWEAASQVLAQGNVRRGAIMAAMRCDHPDIERFIDAGQGEAALANIGLAVLVSDDFMRAVEQDAPWPLVFPLGEHPIPGGGEVCERVWSGAPLPQLCLVHRRVSARALWGKLLAAIHATGEPRMLFIDRINRDNNLWYAEQLSAVSPGGALPLPPFGACNLGSINLPRLVQQPFSRHPRLDTAALVEMTKVATRFLDNVHDISLFPLKAQEKAAGASRRIGLGITGLADMFAMLGLRYGCDSSDDLTREILELIRDTAYRTSVALAQEKGVFPEFDPIKFGASPFVLGLPRDIQDAIALHGIRNSHLLAISDVCSVSLLANNTSCGMVPSPPASATGASPQDQLRLMATAQACVDGAIAATLHLPAATDVPAIDALLWRAWELGLKGCALARTGCRVEASSLTSPAERAPQIGG
jgi:ribonucleoside-diphosphate reductase alpha chain